MSAFERIPEDVILQGPECTSKPCFHRRHVNRKVAEQLLGGTGLLQKGIRVTTVMSELGAEKIDIIPYDPDPARYVANSLSPARVLSLTIDEAEHKAHVEVADEQLSLAIGKGGQNVRLAAKLTGWRIDIKGVKSDEITSSDGETVEVENSNGEVIAEEGAPQDTNADMETLAEEVSEEGEE
jgi:N utilization substance protein A